MKIAFKCTNWLGDVVMATAALKSIRKSFPEDKITAIVRPGHAELLEGSPLFDELLKVDETGWRVFKEGILLRRYGFDMAIILPRAFRAAWLMRLSGASRRVGFSSSGRGFLLTDPVEYKPRRNTRDMYLRVCHVLGCSEITGNISLPLGERHEMRARELMAGLGERLTIGLVPGGSFGSAKLWPVEHFAKAADLIRKHEDARFIILHGPGEEAIAKRLRQATIATLTVCEGLGVLKSVVKRLDLLITNDTGPRHVGVALGVPTVVLMGPTRPEYTDYPAEKLSVLREEVDCGPCQKKICPADLKCMRNLSPERVAQRCLEMIESSKGEG